VRTAAQDGLKEVQEMIELEKRLFSKGLTGKKSKCPARRNVHRKPGTDNQSRLQSIKALAIIEASKKLKKR
jgi:hypothetical protein